MGRDEAGCDEAGCGGGMEAGEATDSEDFVSLDGGTR
jgi:hypothetical protein